MFKPNAKDETEPSGYNIQQFKAFLVKYQTSMLKVG